MSEKMTDATVIASELARIDGYDPEDKHGGLYDLRWSSGPNPEPQGDAWTMDYLPKAERIASRLAQQPVAQEANPFCPILSQKFAQGSLEDLSLARGRLEGLSIAIAECDRLTVALDYGGNEYRRPAPADQCARSLRAIYAKFFRELYPDPASLNEPSGDSGQLPAQESASGPVAEPSHFAIKYPFCVPALDLIQLPEVVKTQGRADQISTLVRQRYGEPAIITPLYAAPPAQQEGALTAVEISVIEQLIALGAAALLLADNTVDNGDSLEIDREDFDALSKCLDVLDELPDDQPGYTMHAAGKAQWALRRVLAASGAQGGES